MFKRNESRVGVYGIICPSCCSPISGTTPNVLHMTRGRPGAHIRWCPSFWHSWLVQMHGPKQANLRSFLGLFGIRVFREEKCIRCKIVGCRCDCQVKMIVCSDWVWCWNWERNRNKGEGGGATRILSLAPCLPEKQLFATFSFFSSFLISVIQAAHPPFA